MTIGQSVLLDALMSGPITDAVSLNDVVVAITVPLVGNLTLLDGDGNTVLSKTAGQNGAFALAGTVYRLEYALSSASDLGVVTVAFRPI